MDENRSSVHLAGNTVIFGRDRMIQRCLVCGYKLIDITASRTCIADVKNADGSEPDNTIRGWPIGALVRVSGTFPIESSFVGETENPEFDEKWEDCCLRDSDGE